MANLFGKNETLRNASKIRTPMDADNKYKRIGLLILGVACIVAGIIIWISTANSNANNAANANDSRTTAVQTTAQTTAAQN